MRCHVYRCRRRVDTYVYLVERDAFERLPAALQTQLGALEFVLDFDLDGRRALGREDPAVLRRNLDAQGFHVQFPPLPDMPLHGRH